MLVLRELEACNSEGITDVGRSLAKLSIEPRLGKVGYHRFMCNKGKITYHVHDKKKILYTCIKMKIINHIHLYLK